MEDVAVAKKRGRPSKGGGGGAATSSSPVDNIPTIPKKRGRPPKMAKGRGRPPKVFAAAAGSDNEDLDQDEMGEANGELAIPPLKVSSGRGRGRPKAVVPDHDDDGDSSADEKSTAKPQKSPSSAKRRKLGRPKKHQPSDNDDDDEEEEERRPIGRPNTGAINLNIVATGRGQGRPKKVSTTYVPSGKPRGRPKADKAGAAAYVPSGKPRGRPKAENTLAKEAADAEKDDESEDEKSVDGEESPVVTPKKRGRPPASGNTSAAATGKSRGRPKTNKSPSYQMDEVAEDEESATEVGDESNGNVGNKRGRPALATPRGRGKLQKSGEANDSENSLSGDEDNDDSSGPGKVSGELAANKSSDSKSERKEIKSPENGDGDDVDGDADADAGEETADSIECISDEP